MRLPKNFARSSLASRKAHAFKSSMTANSSESPFNRFKRWFDAARRAGEPCPEAMALATADPGGGGAVRFVLLKEIDARGFVFYTDLRSRKGRDLLSNPRAALGFYWHKTGRQVRVEGKVERVDDVVCRAPGIHVDALAGVTEFEQFRREGRAFFGRDDFRRVAVHGER